MDVDYRIVGVHGHYAVYINDEFYCSADTFEEAKYEVEEYLGDSKNDNKAVADWQSVV